MPALPEWAWRAGRRVLIGLAAIVVLIAIPILWTEAACRGTRAPDPEPFQSTLEAAHRRDEVNTYLTYPEWSIVHAYEDLAGVTRKGSESNFAYLRSIANYWSSLCSLTRLATSRGSIAFDYKLMLYTIGISFAAEMGLKGAYELTVGRATAWIRGPQRTPEDDFALAVADEYAAFLRQTPWFEFPFGTKLWQLWAGTPLWGGNIVRKVERRISLTLEYAGKAVYARLIAIGAGASGPVALRIRSVVSGLDASDVAADSRIAVVRTLASGASEVETPRYRAFTEVVAGLAERGRNVVEIAGNDDVLITVLAPQGKVADNLGKQLFEVPIQARPGWRRIGLDVKVASLASVIRQLRQDGMELEHVYDY
ncbi:MAG TPA: hypothetical protein VN524_20775 [Hyphomicrobiaceae bacterium]|jgi:hypothetical protein|nr:hypothetical protein [Hyphomicrobiaceae bacterium]